MPLERRKRETVAQALSMVRGAGELRNAANRPLRVVARIAFASSVACLSFGVLAPDARAQIGGNPVKLTRDVCRQKSTIQTVQSPGAWVDECRQAGMAVLRQNPHTTLGRTACGSLGAGWRRQSKVSTSHVSTQYLSGIQGSMRCTIRYEVCFRCQR
ncbi:MAG: hypothetical protein GC150_05885 [Rhizobiales bacterium]|nr:hypothetical protein [Hyphomicrobiales bacterium]